MSSKNLYGIRTFAWHLAGIMLVLSWIGCSRSGSPPAAMPAKQHASREKDARDEYASNRSIPEGEQAESEEDRRVELARQRERNAGDEGEDEEREATGAIAAAKQRQQMRLGSDGTIPPNALMIAKQQADAMAISPGPADDGVGTRDAGISSWEWLGPGNVGGRVRAIAIDPSNPQLMWAGTASGGIWKTTNAGQNWTLINDFMASLAVSSLVFKPGSSSVMYAGTGESIFTLYSTVGTGLSGGGIFRSPDGGMTWNVLPRIYCPDGSTLSFSNVARVALDPAPPSGQEVVLAATDNGLLRSTNAGQCWFNTGVVPQVMDLKFRPGARTVLAGTNVGTILRSTDGGLTWLNSAILGTLSTTTIRVATAPDGDTAADSIEVASTTGFAGGDLIRIGSSTDQAAVVAQVVDGDTLLVSDLAGAHAVGEQIISLPNGRFEVAWGSGSRVYAGMDANGGRVFRSDDGGITFNLVSPLMFGYMISAGNSQGNYDNAVWASPDDPNLVVVGGLDLWRSTDGGQNFSRISEWSQYRMNLSAHGDQHVIVSPPDYNASNRRVYVGNDGGVQMAQNILTTQQTSGWTRLVTGLGCTQFYGGAVYPGGDRIFGGAQDNSTQRLHGGQGPNAWYQATTGDGTYCAVVPGLPLIAYMALQNLDFRKSTNGGDSYIKKQEGLEDAVSNPPRTPFIAPFVIDPNDHQILVAGGQSVYRTTDGADFWNEIRTPITYTTPGPTPTTVTQLCSAIEVAQGNSQNIWVGYTNGTVSHTDGANVNNWSDVQANGLTRIPAGRYVTDIAINPQNANEVFVTLGGYATDTVWFTGNGGTTWQNRNGPPPPAGGPSFQLPAIQVNTIRFHPLKPKYVYVGTDLGVFASQHTGLTWNRAPSNGNGHDGPANVEVDELFWDYDTLYAATHGRGMYRTRPAISDCLAWTQLTPAAEPAPRYGHAMVFDSDRHVVVLFGGGAPPAQYGDTWEFNGTTWVNRGVTNGPSPRNGHGMAFDPVRHRALLFGGYDGNNYFDDTWEWDGNTWTQRTPQSRPAARYLHAMAYDAVSDRIVLYGGSQNATGYFDTWEWNPGTGEWVFLNDAGTSPNPHPTHCQGHAMAFNPVSQRVMMAGGTSPNFFDNTNGAWEWDRNTRVWVPLAVLPNYTYRPALAFDATRNRMRLYGGSANGANSPYLDHTYEWDGAAWILVGVGAPPGRTDPVMVYDSLRDVTVLFGGRMDPNTGRFGDTWALQTSRPNITTQPQCTIVREGQTITLSVAAAGTDPLTYRWEKIPMGPLSDDGRITGSMTQTLMISPSQANDTGDYRVRVSDRCNGSTNSATVRVVVHAPLTGGSQVTAFGINGFGQLGRGTTCSGNNCDTRIREVNNIGNVVQVAANSYGFHTLAVSAGGTVRAWGANSYGQIGNGTVGTPVYVLEPHTIVGLTDVIAVAAGQEFSLALKSDGTVWGWGTNWSYALGNAVPFTGAVSTPTRLPDLSCIVAIGATALTSYAMKSDGSLWSWGYNGSGELGIGSTGTQQRIPQPVLNLGSGVTQIAGGLAHALALKSDGSVWGWGDNENGQTGDGTPFDRYTPAQIAALSNIVKVRAGAAFGLALRNDGVVLGWGQNGSGQLGIGSTSPAVVFTPTPTLAVSPATDLAAGYNHSLFLRPDGTVWSSGTAGFGELGYPNPPLLGTPQRITRILFPCMSVATGGQWSMVRHARTPPYLDLQPVPQTALVGGTLRLTTDRYGTPVITQNWFHNGNNFIDDGRVQGAFSPNLTISPVIMQDAGTYYVHLQNMQGVLDSNTVNVTVVPSPFCDDFTTGASPYWGHEVGNWSVSNGAYRSSSNTYSSLPFELADFAMDVDILNMQTGGIWLRSSGTPVFLLNAVQLRHSGGSLAWNTYTGGNPAGPFATVNNAYTVGADVHLRIEVTGDTYKVFINGAATPATQFTTALFASGRVALNDYSGPQQSYDRVCVSTSFGRPDGNMNGDAVADGDDVQAFVGAVAAGANDPNLLAHGDFNGNGVMDPGDVPGFAQALLGP